jgi:GGDEF domain-containing protein
MTIPSYDDPHTLLEAILLHVARQINEPIVIDGIEMMVTTSIGGVIRTPGEQASLRRLLHSADKAMYRAKGVEDGVAIGDIQRQSESTQRHEPPNSLSIPPPGTDRRA